MIRTNVFQEMIGAIYALAFVVAWTAGVKWLAIPFGCLAAFYYILSMRTERMEQMYIQACLKGDKHGRSDDDACEKDREGED